MAGAVLCSNRETKKGDENLLDIYIFKYIYFKCDTQGELIGMLNIFSLETLPVARVN